MTEKTTKSIVTKNSLSRRNSSVELAHARSVARGALVVRAPVTRAGPANGSRQETLTKHQPRAMSRHKMSVATHG